MKFRTYGTKMIDKTRKYSSEDMRTNWRNKPNGLWASPIGRKFISWDKWCLMEEFQVKKLDQHVDFTLKLNTKILYLRNEKEFDEAYKKYGYKSKCGLRRFNWKQIESEYDAVLFFYSGFDQLGSKYDFNRWDVDSLVVFNLEKIKC